MTSAELAEVRLGLKGLTALGFSSVDAARLMPLLPPIEVGVLVQAEHDSSPQTPRPHASPAAALLWYVYELCWQDARDLASAGRGVVDLIVIVDAVGRILPLRKWDRCAVALAWEWGSERTVPRDRIGPYIAAGIRCDEAARFEKTEPATRPTIEQLQLLAALRSDGTASAHPT